MADTYVVTHNIESLEEIVNKVSEECTTLICFNNGLRSLKGIERLPQIVKLYVYGNKLEYLEYLAGSNITYLDISDNKIRSLQGIIGSNITHLNIHKNRIRSLRGIAESNVTTLFISNNKIRSLEGIAESNVTTLSISNNKIQSLKGIEESNVTYLDVYDNPCYNEFIELGESVKKAKEKYKLFEAKEPSDEWM